jgi:two-component system, NarL family, sensor kinase
MNFATVDIAVFLIAITAIIVLLTILIVAFVYAHQKNRYLQVQILNSLKADHEHRLRSAQLEIQESTCQSISREIHDNINLSLTVVKLNLNTFDWINQNKALLQLESSIQILGKVISDLSDISKSLNSEMLMGLGLISAIEYEIDRIRATNIFDIEFDIIGESIGLQKQKELIIFRIIQEAFNNIIKHANANSVKLKLHYSKSQIFLEITDNGKGFEPYGEIKIRSSGLKNMQSRTRMLQGNMIVESKLNIGTTLSFKIPVD